jgi:hypothetical protein
MTDVIENGTIARIEVTRGDLTEYPIAEKTKGGWQNGVTFYPDADVTKVKLRYAHVRATGADEALRLLGIADQRPSQEWTSETGESKSDVIAAAQVHATLALVEQQRIANLIAYLVLIGETPGPDDDRQIREGLGL